MVLCNHASYTICLCVVALILSGCVECRITTVSGDYAQTTTILVPRGTDPCVGLDACECDP